MTKITRGKFKTACDRSGGVLQVIADRLKVTRKAVYDYTGNHEWAKEYLHQSREQLVDLAESKLVQKLNEGESWATQFTLKTLGKNRGYVEKSEVAHSGQVDNHVSLTISLPDDFEDDEKKEIT